IMMGRGVMANPALGREIRGGAPASADELRTFHDMLIHGYIEDMNDKTNAILRMKELWSYMGAMFPDAEKPLKQLRKSKRPEDYFAAVDEVFEMAQ
ncbi:MAG: diguanylate cyclase, partial [Christensenellales bacterium]